MPLDNYTGISLRKATLETFIEFVNQETDIGRLANIGGYIIENIDINRRFDSSQYLKIDKLLTPREGQIRLEIIENRRKYLIRLRDNNSELIERELKKGTYDSVRTLMQKLEEKDKKENQFDKFGGIIKVQSRIKKGESSNSNN